VNDVADPFTFEPGHYPDMAAEDYHAAESISASGAKKILKSPAHYRFMRTKPNEPTPQMQFGTVCHDGVLEPATLLDRVVCVPEDAPNKPTAAQLRALKPAPSTLEAIAFWSAFRERSVGKIILAADEFARAKRCIDAVLSHPGARYLLEGAAVEHSLFWRDKLFDVPCKARLDARQHGGVTDLKTCADASPEGFARAIAQYDYHLQGAAYFSGCEHVLDATPEFFAFVCVETEEPHAVACYQLGRASIQAGARLWDEALSRYKAALELGRWNGYPETIDVIEAPRWKLKFDA
jgi:exodeoxyribonuclease VIII